MGAWAELHVAPGVSPLPVRLSVSSVSVSLPSLNSLVLGAQRMQQWEKKGKGIFQVTDLLKKFTLTMCNE